jgi:NitT/TauT family transport system ATP-binding protein
MSATAEGARAAIVLRGVRKRFEGASGGGEAVDALAPVDLEIAEGSFVALVGPSGCGKSTLLRIVAGLEPASEGEVSVRDRDRIAYVFQDAQLLPWRTVADNVALPLELRGAPRGEIDAAVAEALASVELGDVAGRYPAALSGGMRMRASIARALVTKPRLLLMDEPFAALDEITRHRLDERLLALFRAQRFTVLFVTHGIFEATFLAERAIVLSKRPGRIVHDEPVALPDERVAALRGEPEFAREAGKLARALEAGAS